MPLDFTLWIHHTSHETSHDASWIDRRKKQWCHYLDKIFLNTLFDQQSNFENDFPSWNISIPDKQETPEEGWRIQWQKQ